MTSKWRKWILILVGVAIAIALFVLLTREREPSYQGQSLTQWLVKGRAANFTLLSPEQDEAIRHMGTNALPFLVKWVRDDSSGSDIKSLVSKLPASITPWSIRRWAGDDSKKTRAIAAAFAFVQLGDEAQSAIPELTTVMTNSAATNASKLAVIALAGIGKAAIPALTAQLANTNAPNRREVAYSFGWSPSLRTNAAFATSAVPLLVGCLNVPHSPIGRAAIMSLGQMAEHDHSQSSLVVPALTNCLNGKNPHDLRIEVASALGNYGVSASNAIPSLLVEIKSPDQLLRDTASNALLKIAPWEVTSFPTLVPIDRARPHSAPPRLRGESP